MERTGFHIRYENPRKPVPEPERYEGYNLEDALGDYLPSGARATIEIGDYALEMTGAKLADLVGKSLELAEQLTLLPADDSEQLRASIPDLPPGVKSYCWIFGDFILWLPLIVFATDGTEVRIYTRTYAETEGSPLIVWERDNRDPIVVPHGAVVEEILTFLSAYLDDLVGAFPFLDEDDQYREYRQRIARLSLAKRVGALPRHGRVC